MLDFSKPFGHAAMLLVVSAALHNLVIVFSMGGHLVTMITGAALWIACAHLLGLGSRWIAGVIFLLALFIAVTVPLASAMSETGLVAWAFWGIVLADLGAAVVLFLALWRAQVNDTAIS